METIILLSILVWKFCKSSNRRSIKAEPLASCRFPALSPVSACYNVAQTLPSRDFPKLCFNRRQSYCRARSSPSPPCGVVRPDPLPTSRCACEQGSTRFHCWQSQCRRRAVGECLHEHDERSTRVLVPPTQTYSNCRMWSNFYSKHRLHWYSLMRTFLSYRSHRHRR